MLEYKLAQFYSKVAQKVAQLVFLLNVTFSIIAQKDVKYFGSFCRKICGKDLSKVAQSGHTARHPSPLIRSSCILRTNVCNVFSVTRLGCFCNAFRLKAKL